MDKQAKHLQTVRIKSYYTFEFNKTSRTIISTRFNSMSFAAVRYTRVKN